MDFFFFYNPVAQGHESAAAAAIVTQDFNVLEAGETPQMALRVFVLVIGCWPSCSEAFRLRADASTRLCYKTICSLPLFFPRNGDKDLGMSSSYHPAVD